MCKHPARVKLLHLFAVSLLILLTLLAGCNSPAANDPRRQPDDPNAGVNPPASQPTNPDLILATTTSTQDSGLLDELIPAFQQLSGYRVKIIAVGTGQALALGERGEADVLLVHAPGAEKRLVESGAAIERTLVMHNDFILVGPHEDPAGVRNSSSAVAALIQIAAQGSPFVSRGDDSGTHKKERAMWREAAIQPKGPWYLESGSGMGLTLNIAAEKRGYTLTDRGTYLAQRENLSLAILLEGKEPMLNPYHIMAVNPAKYAKVNVAGARALASFLLSQKGQQLIGSFGVETYGAPLFFPDGGKSEEQL